MSDERISTALRAVERELIAPARLAAIDSGTRSFVPREYREDDPIDPIIRGLLTHLPVAGEVWPEDKRKLWLSLVEGSFKLIYADKPEE